MYVVCINKLEWVVFDVGIGIDIFIEFYWVILYILFSVSVVIVILVLLEIGFRVEILFREVNV